MAKGQMRSNKEAKKPKKDKLKGSPASRAGQGGSAGGIGFEEEMMPACGALFVAAVSRRGAP